MHTNYEAKATIAAQIENRWPSAGRAIICDDERVTHGFDYYRSTAQLVKDLTEVGYEAPAQLASASEWIARVIVDSPYQAVRLIGDVRNMPAGLRRVALSVAKQHID